jgi:plastocyanin
MNKILIMLVTTIVALSLMHIVPGSIQLILLQQDKSAYAQTGGNASPVAAVIIIGKDMQGNVTYNPNNITIKQGEEIFVVNNGTDTQSVTNGMSPDDPLAGKFFDTGPIPPRGFAEFVVSNISPGNYTFYSTNSTSTKGVLIVEPNI